MVHDWVRVSLYHVSLHNLYFFKIVTMDRIVWILGGNNMEIQFSY
jgi:hypothetical protein